MKREAGFSLVELLVAMTVTLIIVAATLSLFVDGLHTNETSTQMGNMNGNLRSALNLMSRDILEAGQGIPTGGVPIPSGNGSQPLNRPAPVGLLTFPPGPVPPPITNLPSVIPGSLLGPGIPSGNTATVLVPQTDMITMIYQDNNLVTSVDTNPASPTYLAPINLTNITSTSMTFNAVTPISGTNSAVRVGDLFLVYGPSPSGGTYRYVAITRLSGQTVNFNNGDVFNLNQQGAAASGTIADMNLAACVSATNCPFTAQRVLMISYFLNVSPATASLPAIPKLMRQVNMRVPPSPVAEVIENLQISYDYVNGTNPINNQKTTPAGVTDNQIRKVNLYLAGRSDNVLSQTKDYMRTNVATQLDVRSLAFVNRYK